MARHERSNEALSPARRFLASVESLEAREVPASAWPVSTLYLGNIYGQFTSDLQNIELHSKATPAQMLALSDDAKAISAATASSSLGPQAGTAVANAVTLQLDRSTLDGWIGPKGWTSIQSRLEPSLQSLGASPSLISQTISDMQAIATSARVSSAEYNTFTNDFSNLRAAQSQPGASSYSYPDPQSYFAQHLLGFFRGGVVNRVADKKQLENDIQSFAASPSGLTVLHRDTTMLETLGASVPTATFSQFLATYQSAVLAPDSTSSSQTVATLASELGNAATAARKASINRLISDAPALFAALGSSAANLETLAADIQLVVSDGVGSTPDPFKVTFMPR